MKAGGGLSFGATGWVIADEGVVPARGLSKFPKEYPTSTHAYAFTSHLVFGLTTEVARRAMHSVM